MLDPHSSTAYSSLTSPPLTDAELEQRLGLYQVFLKLYEHHRSLLDEILDLENLGNRTAVGAALQYIQGIVSGDQVCLISNLVPGGTQALHQSQRIWTIGRDHRVAIPIHDKRLSRYHALIQYVEDQGFILVDLNSTNGSFVNGEKVWRRCPIKDGDRIRLGSLAFVFFVCQTARAVSPESPELLSQLEVLEAAATPNPHLAGMQPSPSPAYAAQPQPTPQQDDLSEIEETSLFLRPPEGGHPFPPGLELDDAFKEEILDQFLNRR